VEVQRADRPYASFYISFTSTERDIVGSEPVGSIAE